MPLFCFGSNNIEQLNRRLRYEAINPDQTDLPNGIKRKLHNLPDSTKAVLGSLPEITIERTDKAKLPNAKRVFTNSIESERKNRGGVATLIRADPGENEEVLGFVFYASPEEIQVISIFEGVPNKYMLVDVPVVVIKDNKEQKIQASTYVMTQLFLQNMARKYIRPKDDYLDKICKTINLHWTKSNGQPFQRNDIKLHPDIVF